MGKKKKGNYCENKKQSIARKILHWLKKNFTATIIGLLLSIIGIILTIFFGIKDKNENFTKEIITNNTPTTIDVSLLNENAVLDENFTKKLSKIIVLQLQ